MGTAKRMKRQEKRAEMGQEKIKRFSGLELKRHVSQRETRTTEISTEIRKGCQETKACQEREMSAKVPSEFPQPCWRWVVVMVVCGPNGCFLSFVVSICFNDF